MSDLGGSTRFLSISYLVFAFILSTATCVSSSLTSNRIVSRQLTELTQNGPAKPVRFLSVLKFITENGCRRFGGCPESLIKLCIGFYFGLDIWNSCAINTEVAINFHRRQERENVWGEVNLSLTEQLQGHELNNGRSPISKDKRDELREAHFEAHWVETGWHGIIHWASNNVT